MNGAPAPYAGDFCFGKSHQNHSRLRLHPSGSLIASVASAGPSKGHPAPAGGRARSLSHPFRPIFVSVGIRFGVRRTNYQPLGAARCPGVAFGCPCSMCRKHKCRRFMDEQERPRLDRRGKNRVRRKTPKAFPGSRLTVYGSRPTQWGPVVGTVGRWLPSARTKPSLHRHFRKAGPEP